MKQTLIRRFRLPISLIVVLLAFLLLTNPQNLPLPLLMVPFGLVFVLFYYVFRQLGRAQSGSNSKQQAIRAGVLAAIPVLLLVLQTIHQLTIKDVLITLGLALLATYYLGKADFLG